MSTINYLYPVAGAAPSSKGVSTCNMVQAQVVMTDGDTSAVVSHNFGAPPGDLTNGWPEPYLFFTTAPTTTIANPLSYVIGTNAVTVAKVAQTGSAFTGIISIKRPHTIVR